MKTLILAHRGASGYAPENTLEAFDLAIKSKADGIELDVHRTSDDQIVVAHDETIDRCSNGKGYIGDMTLAQLRQFDFSCGMSHYQNVKIPTLAEVLELIRPTRLMINIEVKTTHRLYQSIEKTTLALVKEFGMTDRILYSSFNHYSLTTLRALDPNAKLGVLYSEGLVEPWLYAQRIQANALHPQYLNLRVPGYVAESHRAGIQVNVWTLNDEDAIGRALQCGVDGIITNYPDLALRMRDVQA